MFGQLSDRLQQTFNRLRGRGVLDEADVDAALREVRMALLEADVALPVIKRFMALVRERAVGEQVIRSIKPGEQVVKIVHDALVELLGEGEELNLKTQAPAVVLMVGLQGSGKTTTTGKLAKLLKTQQKKKVLLVSLDIYRPAAIEQLGTLAARAEVDFEPSTTAEKPLDIAKRALKRAKTEAYDVLFVDTAGRLEIDATLMDELKAVKAAVQPVETLLVADSLTGQVAVQVAEQFQNQIGVSGICLTRVDGDGRGGAALSMREVTGCPIKYLGMGEGMDALQPFRPEGVASRILQMGDVVALVEKAQAAMEGEDTTDIQEKMMSGKGLDLNDIKKQMNMMRKMGGMGTLMGLMPGMGKLKEKLGSANMDDKMISRQIAIIDSMTPYERKTPDVLNARRRVRIANGSGTSVHEVNKLMKSFQSMNKMMKKMGGLSPEKLEKLQRMLPK